MNRIFPALKYIPSCIGLPCFCAAILLIRPVYGQSDDYDASWYTGSPAFVKIGVVRDGVYRITGNELAQGGIDLSGVNPSTIRFIENGKEIPIWIEGGASNALQPNDALLFVGRRNRGNDEIWAYGNDASLQSSAYHSLYSDTTWYWMAWGGQPGLRYADTDPGQGAGTTPLDAVRDVVHLEQDLVYYFGDSDDAGQPEYTRAEGFLWLSMSSTDTGPVEQSIALDLSDAVSSSDSLIVSAKISSGSAPRHRVTLRLEVSGVSIQCPTCTDEVDWSNYSFQTLRIAMPQSLVSAGNQIRAVITSHNEFNSFPNRILIDWVEASYMRALRIDGDARRFSSPDAGPKRYAISSNGGAPLTVFNPTDQRLFFLGTGSVQTFSDDPTSAVAYWAVAGNGYRSPAAVRIRQTQDLDVQAGSVDYLIITTAALAASAGELAAYRSSTDGYNVRIVHQADIFDQFDYGRPTPIAIRRFVHATQRWTSPPQFIMFWGDALRPADGRARRMLQPWETISFGYSPADGWFGLQQISDGDWIERPAIGRIPIRNNPTGSFFVRKISNYESAPIGAWQKRFLMLVGGQSQFEQARLQAHSLSWGQHAVGAPTGMDTLQFFKTTADPLDPSFQDSLSNAFRDGAAWVSYFGHSAADTWEIVTEDPEDYDNANRLPIVLSLGCNTGNFAGGRFETNDRLVYGERLVLASMNGAIAHWGSSSSSTIDQPAALTNHLHETVFQDTVRVLGLALREAKKRYVESRNPTPFVYNVLLQYGLIGDPATHIRIADKPEFQIGADAITITPLAPSPLDGSMEITVRLRNWGLLAGDSVTVQLTHQMPAGDAQIYARRIVPTRREETLNFTVPISNAAVGDNLFRVAIDPENRYAEVDETNNTAEKTHTVFSAGLIPVDPIDFGLISDLQPTLRVTLATNDTTRRTVSFELDTSASFESPQRLTHNTITDGFLGEWPIDTPLEDHQTYFWRARIEGDEGSSNWQVQRFTIDTGATGSYGWTQRGSQFAGNETGGFLAWSDEQDAWAFTEFKVDVRATSERGNGFEKGQFIVNGTRFLGVTLGFGVLVIDGDTGELREYDSFPTYNISEDLQERFDTDSTRAVASLDSLITNLRTGDYVFVRTRHLGNLSGPTMQPEVKQLFAGLGSQAIDSLDYRHLWIMMTRAGFPGETAEWVEAPGPAHPNEIARDTTLYFNQSQGFTLSPLIGPAQSWGSLRGIATTTNNDSSVRIDVLDPETDAPILTGLSLDAATELSTLSTKDYPFLRLRASLEDASQRTTPQLKDWTVFFEPTNELAIDPVSTTFTADTLSVYQPLDVVSRVVHLGGNRASFATLAYTLTDANNIETLLRVDTLRNFTSGESHISSLTIDTENLAGLNRLRIALDQPGVIERFTVNNVLVREFVVQKDLKKPHLEILIDDEMLPSNFEPVTNLQDPALPFVSARPSIDITVTDENLYRLLDDTSLVQVRLDGRPIPFSHPQIKFEPGTAEKNEARVFFTPDFSGRDTTHTLFVRVFDAAGNEADASPYQVHFRVQAAFEIESLYPYPNPMHTSTTFAFRLRGDNALLADEFRIRVYTLSGLLIKEFDLIDEPGLLETPGLRIGWNKLSWDGRDADGDLIAPGVYLYKVFLRSEGQHINVNNGSSIEKLVVLR